MVELFYEGGTLFMSTLTLELMLLVAVFVYFISRKDVPAAKGVFIVRQLGLLAFISGVLGQAIGLYGALQGIEMMGNGISPEILAGGLKVSMICNIYGIIIFGIAIILSLIIKVMDKGHGSQSMHE
ncbi:MAG TPA: hypothetical protein DCG19_07775 [Cryomorphaceae bacterium]|nr:hypothetical protein [Owenweeksia sp.]HAD97290.1 hypothetical protein [Cryomorphaceae bacterium]HBF19903.1 hypothetical protein [Cryomorphaceae bacterium]|tara:strand:- start:72 stop:449 length:378 start_codon:yes stop_codon:yes gene_type:complete